MIRISSVLALVFIVNLYNSSQYIKTEVLPHLNNRLTPFQINSKNLKDYKVDMQINCGDGIAKIGIIFFGYDICKFKIKDESLDKINIMLENLYLNLENTVLSKDKEESVIYEFQLKKNNKEKASGKVVQQFVMAKTIPVTQLNKNLQLEDRKQPFSFSLFSLQDYYLKNSNLKNLSFISNDLDKYFKLIIKGDMFYLEGNGDKLDFVSRSIAIKIFDKVTGLYSKELIFEIKNDAYFVFNKQVSAGIILAAFIITFLTIYLITTVFLIDIETIDKADDKAKKTEIEIEDISFIIKDCNRKSSGSIKDEEHGLRSFEESEIRSGQTINMDEQSLIAEISEFSSMIKHENSMTRASINE